MAYNDPYAAPQQGYSTNYGPQYPPPSQQYPPTNQQQYPAAAHQQGQQQGYSDAQEFNPYEQQPRYPTYDEQPYSDLPGGQAPYADYGRGYVGQDERDREKAYNEARISVGPPPKNTGMLRIWRRDGRGKQWTRGGGLYSCCRFFCCTLLTVVFLIIAVILSLGVFVRPPDVTFNGVSTPTNGVSLFQQEGADSFIVNLELNVGVRNPNFFDVDFNSISAKIFYPGFNPQLGNGTLNNVQFKSNTATTLAFPIALNYSTSADPSLGILTSIADKCGLNGQAQSDINVNFSITLALKILFAQISPTVSASIGFACPFTQSEIDGVIGQILGGNGS